MKPPVLPTCPAKCIATYTCTCTDPSQCTAWPKLCYRLAQTCLYCLTHLIVPPDPNLHVPPDPDLLYRLAQTTLYRLACFVYRRFQYEEEVGKNPLNYDAWFDFVKLEEEAGDVDRVREVG